MIQSFKMALKSIAGNKFRAFLTMLGIIIGVMALVILVSLVSGATGSVTDSISSLGSDQLTVTISDDKGAPVTLETLDEWMGEEGIGLIAPSAETSATVRYEGTSGSMTVYGTTPAYESINGLSLLLGRFIKSSDVDNHTNVAVINETAATELIGYTDCIGEEISLNGVKYSVVGVLEDEVGKELGHLGAAGAVRMDVVGEFRSHIAGEAVDVDDRALQLPGHALQHPRYLRDLLDPVVDPAVGLHQLKIVDDHESQILDPAQFGLHGRDRLTGCIVDIYVALGQFG